MPFHSLIAGFFLVLNNVPLSGCTTVSLIILPLTGTLAASESWQPWTELR